MGDQPLCISLLNASYIFAGSSKNGKNFVHFEITYNYRKYLKHLSSY